MTIDHMLSALADAGTRLLLDAPGTGLRIRGNQPMPDLLAGIREHKAEIIAALQEARSLAIQLRHDGGTDVFERELLDARQVGTLSVADWYAGWLAITLARSHIEKGSLPKEESGTRSPEVTSQARTPPARTSPTIARYEREDKRVD